MASSISIRVYLLQVRRRRDPTKLSFDENNGGVNVPAYVSQFISDCSTVTEDSVRERSWYFEKKVNHGPGNSKGYIHYGTFGFESNIVDIRTNKKKYERQITDSEIVPLFYEFWHPPKAKYMFAVFQSFQGRSCINLVMTKMQELFAEKNHGVLLQFKKLIPSDGAGNIYRNYPVQKLTLIKKDISADIADRYSGARPSEPVNLEVSLTAKRRGSVGLFGFLSEQIRPNAGGVITHDGITFDEATANVRVGGRTRSIGVFGTSSDAGVIDLSDAVKRGQNGHPTLESLIKESSAILKDFHTTIGSTIGLQREN